MLITGPLTARVKDKVLRVWNEIPEPKVTVAVGICPISGGVFREGYSIEGPVDRYLPIDVNVPGCPPRPAGDHGRRARSRRHLAGKDGGLIWNSSKSSGTTSRRAR